MGNQQKPARDLAREQNSVVPETEGGTTSERDFGKTDRYANKDDAEGDNFRTIGDGSSWDSGRGASIAHGTHNETDMRAADAETPGVKTRPAAEAIKDEKS